MRASLNNSIEKATSLSSTEEYSHFLCTNGSGSFENKFQPLSKSWGASASEQSSSSKGRRSTSARGWKTHPGTKGMFIIISIHAEHPPTGWLPSSPGWKVPEVGQGRKDFNIAQGTTRRDVIWGRTNDRSRRRVIPGAVMRVLEPHSTQK